jgi:chromosome segregation ATPase
MKNFLSILKSKVASIFPDANFTEETNESEVVTFLEGKEGVFAQLDALAKDLKEAKATADKATTTAAGAEAKATDHDAAMESLMTAVTELSEAHKTTQSELVKIHTNLNKISAGFNNKPDDVGGDPAPITAKKEGDETTYSIGKRSKAILESVKTGIKY